MRILLILLLLLPESQCVRQFQFDRSRCLTDLLCLVPPESIENEPKAADTLKIAHAAVLDAGLEKAAVYLRPSPGSLFIAMHLAYKPTSDTKSLNLKEGLRLVVVEKVAPFNPVTIFGCNEDGLLTGNFSSELLRDDTPAAATNKLYCTGIVESASWNLASDFAAFSSETHEIRLDYVVNFARASYYRLANDLATFWSEVNKRVSCEWSLLRVPVVDDDDFPFTHDLVEADFTANLLDCKGHLIEATAGDYDLVLKRSPQEHYRVVKKITCEKKTLFYHTSEGKLPILRRVFVACGMRPKCKSIPHFECEFCKKPTINEVETGKVTKMECPYNRWMINEGVVRKGTVDCWKDSREPWSEKNWVILNGQKKIKVTKASCYRRADCRLEDALHSECDDLRDENCTSVSFTPETAYCPRRFNMKYQTRRKGEVLWLATSSLQCDGIRGKWRIEQTRSELFNVFCLYNASGVKTRRKQIKGLRVILIVGAVVVVALLLFDAAISFVYLRKIREWEEEEPKTKMSEKAKETKRQTKKDTESASQSQPANRLFYKELSTCTYDYICKGMLDNFDLFPVADRAKFLENCIRDLGKDRDVMEDIAPVLMHVFDRPELPTLPLLFCTLKVIAFAFFLHGKREIAFKMRDTVGMVAFNIVERLGWERKSGEGDETTKVRGLALRAMLYAGHRELEKRLADGYTLEKHGMEVSTRKIVWAHAVRRMKKFEEIKGVVYAELHEVARAESESEEEDRSFGTRLDHAIYAACSGKQAQDFMNDMLKEPLFTASHILIAFEAMLEDFQDKHTAARFLYTERHFRIVERMPVGSAEYRQLFEMFYRYAILTRSSAEWLMRFVATEGNFTAAEKAKLDLASAAQYAEVYNSVHAFDGSAAELARILQTATSQLKTARAAT